MTTAITLDMVTRAFDKRGVKWKFYKDRADALVHNRNKAGANTSVTAGGFGPLKGLLIHNFASDISDANSLAYLYNGDAGRSLPGPLAQFAIDDAGTVWIIGWGTANHSGPGDKDTNALVEADKMPLNGEVTPNTTGTSTTGTVPINPFYLGVEMLYGKAPTTAQRAALIRWAATLCDLLGYTGRSIAMHREMTMNRSDPVGFTGGSIRTAVNAMLTEWSTPVTTQPTTPTTPELPNPPAGLKDPTTYAIWYWDGLYEPHRKIGSTNPFWTPASYLREIYIQNEKILENQARIIAKLGA